MKLVCENSNLSQNPKMINRFQQPHLDFPIVILKEKEKQEGETHRIEQITSSFVNMPPWRQIFITVYHCQLGFIMVVWTFWGIRPLPSNKHSVGACMHSCGLGGLLGCHAPWGVCSWEGLLFRAHPEALPPSCSVCGEQRSWESPGTRGDNLWLGAETRLFR